MALNADLTLSEVSPINKDESVIRRQELDNFAEISRSERSSLTDGLSTVLRALKILEQMVFSRSRFSVPLQKTLSIAGIVNVVDECAPLAWARPLL